MPIIPMKPLDAEPEFRSAFSEREEEEEDEYVEDEPRHDRLDGPLLTVLETGGGFLSRVLGRLTPLANRLTTRRADDSGSYRDDVGDIPRQAAAPPAERRVLTLAEDPAPSRDAADDSGDWEDDRPSLFARVSGWMRGLVARPRRSELRGAALSRSPSRPRPARRPLRPRESRSRRPSR